MEGERVEPCLYPPCLSIGVRGGGPWSDDDRRSDEPTHPTPDAVSTIEIVTLDLLEVESHIYPTQLVRVVLHCRNAYRAHWFPVTIVALPNSSLLIRIRLLRYPRASGTSSPLELSDRYSRQTSRTLISTFLYVSS